MQTPRMKSPANYRNLTLFLSFLGGFGSVLSVLFCGARQPCQNLQCQSDIYEAYLLGLAISHMLGCQRHHRALLSVY